MAAITRRFLSMTFAIAIPEIGASAAPGGNRLVTDSSEEIGLGDEEAGKLIVPI